MTYKIILLLFLAIFITPGIKADDNSKMTGQNVVSDSYQIGPGDVLRVSVWKEEDLQMDVLVRPDGGITFPLAGEINAKGLTAIELSDVLFEKLKRYIPHPNITVIVIQSVSNKLYVIGKVARPGEYVATGYMDVLQALTLAGGLTPYADGDEIKILRRTESGTSVMEFDYDDVVSGERLDMNIILKPGDTVVVP